MKSKRITNMKTKKRIQRIYCAAMLSIASLLALAPAVRANTFVYTVVLNVGALDTDPNGPYSLDLQLAPGSNNISNSVTLSNFSLTGGAFTGAATEIGGVSGSTASSLVITNSSDVDNEWFQEFTPSTTQIAFKVTETNNQETVTEGTPINEEFNVAILDTNLNNISTNSPGGTDLLIQHVMDGGPQNLGSVGHWNSNDADGQGNIGVTAIPEPGSTAMLGIGCTILAFWLRRKAFRVCA
jgi:hypothetical protein